MPGYITEKTGGFDDGEVVSTSKIDVRVLEALGKPARQGWFASDDGTIFIQLNDGPLITLNVGDSTEIWLLNKDPLEIERIRITTASAVSLSFRLFLY